MKEEFYLVDNDVYIKVFNKDGLVVAENQFGNPVAPLRALEGRKVDQEAFNRAVAIASASR